MRTFAYIEDGKVVNMVIAEEDLTEQSTETTTIIDVTDMDPQPQMEWLYVDGVFSEPPPVVFPPPIFLSRYAVRRVLFDAGELAAADAHFAAMPDTSPVRFEWEHRSRYWLESDAVQEFKAFRGWTDEQLADLFRTARFTPD